MGAVRSSLLALGAASRSRSHAARRKLAPRSSPTTAVSGVRRLRVKNAVVMSSSAEIVREPPYPVGTPGVKWGDAERKEWRALVETPKRSYASEVLSKLEPLKDRFDVVRYGALPYDDSDPERYPLFAVKTKDWNPEKPSVLVTGGVHGYETSGVQGALRFLDTRATAFAAHFNICVAPCVSPWGYERIQRWNAMAVDPNRSFDKKGPPPAEESASLMRFVQSLAVDSWLVHMDLHETTDTDETEFRPAKAARDGEHIAPDAIPDGFYCVGDAAKPEPAFQKAIIDAVRAVTHIAPADAAGKIIGEEVTQPGVINYPIADLGLCASMTGAKYTATTEVRKRRGERRKKHNNP